MLCDWQQPRIQNYPRTYWKYILNTKLNGRWIDVSPMINQGDFISSSTCQWDYDVFLSFRDEDTCNGFASHLCKALCEKAIKF